MRCAISSRAGQVLARGHLRLGQEDPGSLRLEFCTDSGRVIVGGLIGPAGDLTLASETLLREMALAWA